MKTRIIIYLCIVVVILALTVMYQGEVIRQQRIMIRAVVETYCGMRPMTTI